jgi:hypothetical protein
MTVQEIQALTLEEMEELLKLNTIELKYEADDLPTLLEETLAEYLVHRNSLLEKKALWINILVKFFSISPMIVEAIVEKLNWFNFILWCEEFLMIKKEIAFIVKTYYEFKQDNTSATALLNDIIESVLTSLTEIQPEQIGLLFSQLESQMKNLPGIIKEGL